MGMEPLGNSYHSCIPGNLWMNVNRSVKSLKSGTKLYVMCTNQWYSLNVSGLFYLVREGLLLTSIRLQPRIPDWVAYSRKQNHFNIVKILNIRIKGLRRQQEKSGDREGKFWRS